MKLAICNETFRDWPHDKACTYAAELGYTGLEIAPFTLGKSAREISPAQRREVRRVAEAAGLEIIGLHWLLAFTEGYYLTSPDGETRRRTSDYLGELALLCRDLGGSLMVLGSPKQRNLLPGVSHAEAMEYAAATIRDALPAFERQQVTLAVEPLGPEEGDFLRTAALGRELCRMVASPWVRLHLDVKAMSTDEAPIPEVLRASREYLHHFHANDPNRRGPGMGAVDFLPILQALREIQYGGWVSVEVFDYAPGPEALARESIEYLQKCERALG